MHTRARKSIGLTLLSLVALVGCPLEGKRIGDLPDTGESGDANGDDDSTGDGDGDTTGDGDDPFDDCVGPFSSPLLDPDCDGVGIACDNAREHHNPAQLDQDEDGFGDVVDLCPLTPSNTNTADSDKDGFGNDCDICRQSIDKYNLEAAMVEDPRMWVRNVPNQDDFDQDGIGDVCDNCVTVANCGAFNPDNPHSLGTPVPYEDAGACQTDVDVDMIGDACIDPDTMMPVNDFDNAAGPVGFEATDDFDQDGIINLEDGCPRQPLAGDYADRLECDSDIDCNLGGELVRSCASTSANNGATYCNHTDRDGDGVGDVCDTCPHNPNPMQVTDVGMQIDDEDGDFVGAACESNSACGTRKDARPIAFYDVSVDELCCVTTYPGDGQIHDPDGRPVSQTCSPADEDAGLCRALPSSVSALRGVVELPPGCAQALADAGKVEATALTLDDVGQDADALWAFTCQLPQFDQDFDGVGDACDLCPHAFDPFNEPYVDENNEVIPNVGAACAGAHEGNPGAACLLP